MASITAVSIYNNFSARQSAVTMRAADYKFSCRIHEIFCIVAQQTRRNYRLDNILDHIVFNLLDSFIIGGANAIFMSAAQMQYVGLVSIVVAISNLIPTFGPVIGGAVGSFILLMVKPAHALIFLIFTLVLQFCDGYIIKPRLFGNSLGVSGLWILVAIIAGGGMFGVAGILLAIPAVAIIDLLYGSYLLPWLESRQKNIKSAASYSGGDDGAAKDQNS